MTRLSLQWRRTLRYGMVSTCAVVFLGACIYAAALDHLSRQVDAGLTIELQELTQQVRSAAGQADLHQQLDEQFGDRSGFEFQVTGAYGQLLFQSGGLKKSRLPPPAPPPNADPDAPVWSDGEVPRLGPVRCIGGLVARPDGLAEPDDGPLLVQVAMQVAGVQQELDALMIFLLIAGPLVILVLVVAGYWVAGLPSEQSSDLQLDCCGACSPPHHVESGNPACSNVCLD